ncbi:hypothetical protein KKG90_11130 [Candidatus Bipolaricaulota bacterium]|nr:hypothetical protein [Candidatus Bipolaricaulota bacterium]
MTEKVNLRTVPVGIVVGVVIGIALGIALKSIAMSIGVGSGLAIVFGLALDRRRRDDSSNSPQR